MEYLVNLINERKFEKELYNYNKKISTILKQNLSVAVRTREFS